MINDLYTTVSRWKVWEAAKLWNYIKLGTEISWIGSNYVSQDNQTSDGVNFHVRTDSVFQASWFYLSDNRIITIRMNYSILNLAAHMGGMQNTIIGIFGIIGVYINNQLIKAKMIRELYFRPNLDQSEHCEHHENPDGDLKEDKVDDTFTDKNHSSQHHHSL